MALWISGQKTISPDEGSLCCGRHDYHRMQGHRNMGTTHAAVAIWRDSQANTSKRLMDLKLGKLSLNCSLVQQYSQLMPGTAYFFQKIAAFIEHHPQQTHAKNSHKHGVKIQLAPGIHDQISQAFIGGKGFNKKQDRHTDP